MHDGRQTKVQNPVTFEKWFLLGIRKYEKQGAEFELLPGLVKITWPGKPSIFRSVDNLKQEYETEYLSKF